MSFHTTSVFNVLQHTLCIHQLELLVNCEAYIDKLDGITLLEVFVRLCVHSLGGRGGGGGGG